MKKLLLGVPASFLKRLDSIIGRSFFTKILKPVIHSQPVSVTVNNGLAIEFEVLASGSNLQYQWQYYDSSREKWFNVTSNNCIGKDSKKIIIPPDPARSGVPYRCKVFNDFGTVFSDSAMLLIPDVESLKTFLDAMRKKAVSLGMDNTVITSPSGLNKSTVSTAKDLLIMTTVGYTQGKLAHFWGEKTKEIKISGSRARTVELISTVSDDIFGANYHILGGKTGTLKRNDSYFRALTLVASDKQGRLFAGVILDSEDRWAAMKSLFDKMLITLDHPETDPYAEPVSNAQCCIGWQIPSDVPFEPTKPYPILYAQNAEQVQWTASTIKTLSMLTAIDIIKDLNAYYTIQPGDIERGSGNVFMAGDIVKISDLIYAAMLPSSNTAAKAIAHCAGEIARITDK